MTSLGLGLSIGLGVRSPFNPVSLFSAGEKGLIWDFSKAASVFSDAGVTQAVIDGPIGRIVDQSPNGANGNQTTAGSKPLWKTSGGRYSAQFDGVDDFLQTAAIDFTGTDKITIVAGVRKLSTPAGVIAGLSTGVANNGSFNVAANWVNADDYTIQLKGSGGIVSYRPRGYAVPVSNVITGIMNIGGATLAEELVMRVNGVATTANPTGPDTGTGNFGNYAIYAGRRGSGSDPLNGQIFAIFLIGRLCTAAEVAAIEAWVNARTGAY